MVKERKGKITLLARAFDGGAVHIWRYRHGSPCFAVSRKEEGHHGVSFVLIVTIKCLVMGLGAGGVL